jgi:hypothetical protein
VLSSQVTSVTTARLSSDTTIPPAIKTTVQKLVNQGEPKQVVITVVSGVVRQINAGLASVPAGPAGHPPLLDAPAITSATGAILDRAETDGARSAGDFAALFVLLGALSSLLIPNPERRDDTPAQPAAE